MQKSRFSADTLRDLDDTELQGTRRDGAQLYISFYCCVVFCLAGQFNRRTKNEIHFSVLSLIFLLPVYLILTLPYSSFSFSVLLYQCTDNIYLSILFFFCPEIIFLFLKRYCPAASVEKGGH